MVVWVVTQSENLTVAVIRPCWIVKSVGSVEVGFSEDRDSHRNFELWWFVESGLGY